MSTRSKATLLTLLALVAFSVMPALASAAPFDTSDSVYEVQFWPEGDPATSVLLVSITLPEGTQLPATVRMPVPPETRLTWAGEVFGGDGSRDIERQAQVVQGEGGASIEITLEETLTAQYDAVYRPVQADGADFSIKLDWTQTEPAKEVSFGVKVPGSVEDVVIQPDAPGSPQVNSMGERLYTLTPMVLAPGDATAVSVEYARPELGGGTQSLPIVPILIFLVIVAVVVLLIVLARQSMAAGADEEE